MGLFDLQAQTCGSDPSGQKTLTLRGAIAP
jgi:hypothetical protein